MAQRIHTEDRPDRATRRRKPVVGVLCCNRVLDGRDVQAVASRFVEPLARISGVSVLLVPAVPGAVDPVSLATLLDGLLLTGACSHVAPERYGSRRSAAGGHLDDDRDEVALRLADRMIEAGRPVFGICRGMQELNVLFGGTLRADVGDQGHYRNRDEADLANLFDHHHDVDVAEGGALASGMGAGRHRVNSVHQQGIARLGAGLAIEAVSPGDGLVEAVSAQPAGGRVLGVQWHPEWDAGSNLASRAFFDLLGAAAHG